MIAVQTLNLYKYYDSGDTNSIRLQLIMLMLSSYLLRKHYDRVILYTDKRTAEMLSDSYYTEIRLLPNDIHQVPIIKKLTETINIDIPIFDCHDPKLKNIIFKIY
jgi:hypothetical protein